MKEKGFYHQFIFNYVDDIITGIKTKFEDFKYSVDEKIVNKFVEQKYFEDDKVDLRALLIYKGDKFYIFNHEDYDEDLYLIFIHNSLIKKDVLNNIFKSNLRKIEIINLINKLYKFSDDELLELKI